MINKTKSSTQWLVCTNKCVKPKIKLFCFPFGGGSASSYRDWDLNLVDDVEVWTVQLPGRENRISEAFLTDASEVVDSILSGIQSISDTSLAFYGHSLGAGLAFQTVDAMRKKQRTLPALLLVSGRLPPHHRYEGGWSERSKEEITEYIRQMGGVPPELLRSNEFLSLFLPRIRADFKLNETLLYDYSPPLDIPICAINGEKDHTINDRDVSEWSLYTKKRFKSITIGGGGHFFIKSHLDEFLNTLLGEILLLPAFSHK